MVEPRYGVMTLYGGRALWCNDVMWWLWCNDVMCW